VSTAELSLSPRPELVRIARMMAVALARRGGMPEELLQEVRLAVGEAATRAVGVHQRAGSGEPITFAFVEDDRGYEVRVHDAGSAGDVEHQAQQLPDAGAADYLDLADDAQMPPEMELALIRGMADELSIAQDAVGGTLVSFRWHR
jgi:anti-sigma regulatory factor (Ser/Thr protein kinase)